MKHLLLLLSFLINVASVVSGSTAPVKLIFDTDMASDCDDAGALAVLHALADKGEVEILAVATNRKDLSNASAAAADAINTYYGRPDIPIGTDKDGARTPKAGRKPSAYCPALRDEYPNDAKPDEEMPDALDIYLKTLRSQPDGSVTICSVGALSNLEDLMHADPALLEAKVKHLVIMGGGFPRTHAPETNILLDAAAAVAVANEWPTPIIWQGYEVGNAMYSGPELVDTPKANPVRRAYELLPFRDGNSLDNGKPNHDLAAVLLAVRGVQPEYWAVIGNGRVVVDSDGHTEWKRDFAKKHRYVKIKNHPRNLLGVIGDLLAAPPATKSEPKK